MLVVKTLGHTELHLNLRLVIFQRVSKFVTHVITPRAAIQNIYFWGTAKQNAEDRQSKGRGGNRMRGTKLTAKDVIVIRGSHETVDELAARFDISRSTVYSVINGSRWGSLNEQGEYNVGK